MKWFRPAQSRHQVALSMIGAKPASCVLVIGEGDGTLAADVARVTGLNGRTLVCDARDDAGPRAEAAAAEAGSLIEFVRATPQQIAEPDETFDVIVWQQMLGALAGDARDRLALEARRLLRPGGRVVSIDGGPRKGLFFRGVPRMPSVPVADILALLGHAGFRAVRLLAESDAGTFIEGTRPRN